MKSVENRLEFHVCVDANLKLVFLCRNVSLNWDYNSC